MGADALQAYHRHCARILPCPLSRLPIDHPTALVFLDETRDDLFFGVGALKLRDPPRLLTRFTELRREHKFDRKLRWSDVGGYAEPYRKFVREAALLVASDETAEFSCTLLDLKKVGGIESHGSLSNAYIRLASETLSNAVSDPDELVCVIADQFDAKDGVPIEQPITDRVNRRKGRLALVSVQRVASAGTDGLQLADVMLGAIAYQFRMAVRTGTDPAKSAISFALLHDGYGRTAYHDAQGGRTIQGRLSVELLPAGGRRGNRAGRRPRPRLQ